MKKISLLMLALLLCGCRMHTSKDFNSPEVSQIDSSDVSDISEPEAFIDYYGTYYQDEIVYVNEDDYAKEADYHFSGFKYVIKKKSFTFETDLIYSDVTYQEQAVTSDDRAIVKATKKYEVYSEGKAIGVTILLDGKDLYIANDAKYHDGYTYVAKMITKKALEERQKAESEE